MRARVGVVVAAAGLSASLLVAVGPAGAHHKPGHVRGPKPSPTVTESPTPTPTPTPTESPSPSPTGTATPTETATPTPTETATPTPTDTGDPLAALPRVPWEGGPTYYEQFPLAHAAGWSDPGFFPLAVFFCKPEHAPPLADLGVNVCMAVEHDGSPLTRVTDTGISVLAQDEWTPAEIGANAGVVGYISADECEMGYSGCAGPGGEDIGEYGRLDIHRERVADLRARNDGRFIHSNFGNGVLGTWWAPNTMDDHVQLVDTSSVDKYAYTSPHVQWLLPQSPYWPAGAEPARASSYGWLAERMRTFQDPQNWRPSWVFVETARPFLTEDGARMIRPDEIEGAVWAAVIGGARGIAYFQHNNDPSCAVYSLVDCAPSIRDRVRAVNGKVTSLAPVLNTQTYVWEANPALSTMTKVHDGWLYVFAMQGTERTSGTYDLRLPAGVTGGTVEVVGEGRTLPATGGQFTDSFAAEHTHHVYRVRVEAS